MSNPRTAISATPPPSESLRIRRAVDIDLPALVALENRIFTSDRLSARQWNQHLASDSARVLVASVDRELVGAAVLFFRRGNDIARLYSLAIAPAMRGRGIGDALLETAESAALARRCRRVRLEVRRENPAARRLYERRGYRLIGERIGYYEDGEDALRYEKTLADP
jgi:ribosomal-protein-alanine acetyltransferase